MHRLVPLLLVLLGACIADFGISKPPEDPPEPTDTDPGLPPEKPPRQRPEPPEEEPEPQETAVEVDEELPPGPVEPPVADAGRDRTVAPLVWLTMNGTGSYDPGGLTPLVYRWRFLQRPPGSTARMLDNRVARPRWFVDIAGTYELQLEVRNRAGLWDPTPDSVLVQAVPDKDFYVQLTWDKDVDLDLHVLRPGAGIFQTPGDACFCNKTPRWYGTAAQNPSLDWDVIAGFGPETTTIKSPAASTWHVQVHYYGIGGNTTCGGTCPTTTATLRYYVLGVEVFSHTRQLGAQGQVWDASIVEWPSQAITPVDQLTSTQRTACW